jgi:hypothetical protein
VQTPHTLRVSFKCRKAKSRQLHADEYRDNKSDINKWKKEADILMNPAATRQEGRKRDLTETPPSTNANTANPSAAKRARIVPSFVHKNYNVVDVGQQVEVLQEELVAVKEELKALRDQHKREIDFLYPFFPFISFCSRSSFFISIVFLVVFVYLRRDYCRHSSLYFWYFSLISYLLFRAFLVNCGRFTSLCYFLNLSPLLGARKLCFGRF